MSRVRLVVDIYEGPKLVLTHIFYGATENEARAYYNAHIAYDAFFRDCISKGSFGEGARAFACEARWRWERG